MSFPWVPAGLWLLSLLFFAANTGHLLGWVLGGVGIYYATKSLARAVEGGAPLTLPGLARLLPPPGNAPWNRPVPANPGPGVAGPLPEYLYHGTSHASVLSIARSGIEGRSAGRAFMAADLATAVTFGRVKAGRTIILRVRARQAAAGGVRIERQGTGYYVAPNVPPQFVDFPLQ